MNRAGVAFLCLLVVAAACSQFNLDVPDAVAIAQGDGGSSFTPIGTQKDAPEGTTSTGGSQGNVGVADASGQTGSSPCGKGTHFCDDVCVSDREVTSCGISCSPCPEIAGGAPTCDGTRCGGTCPAGQKLCHGRCIPGAATCDGSCPADTHDCGGTCAPNTDVNSCGPTSCTPCAAPSGAKPTCDGTTCGFDCGTQKRCGSYCGDCCTDADCSPKPGQLTTCDPIAHNCHHSCPSGSRMCNEACILEGSCCSDADCPSKAGQTAKCDTGSGRCESMCAGNTKPCSGACIPANGCCRDTDCPGNFACVASACSTSVCRGGAQKMSEDCTNGVDDDCDGKIDCEDSDCATGRGCGDGKVCSNGRCTSCRANISCGTNPCKTGVTECSTGIQRCVENSKSDGTLCDNTSCSGRTKTVHQCQNGTCVGSTTTCDGQCNSEGTDCGPFDCQPGAPCGSDTECKTFRLDCNSGIRTCKGTGKADGTPCGARNRHCSGNRLLDGDTCQNGGCAPSTAGRDCGFQCTNDMCIDTPPCDKITCFVDSDGDGFGDPGKPVSACGSCSSGTVSNKRDCCDQDAGANPNGKAHPTPNACGSFDWNCDGLTTPESTEQPACRQGIIPGCCDNAGQLPLTSTDCGKKVCKPGTLQCVVSPDPEMCECFDSGHCDFVMLGCK
jgi:hypothetical protein